MCYCLQNNIKIVYYVTEIATKNLIERVLNFLQYVEI